MRKWVLMKELFDSEELKIQNEMSYLKNGENTYIPMGVEKMNLNHLLLRCPFLSMCLGDSSNDSHYVTYEEGIYLFIFINDEIRCHIAFDLKKKDISYGVMLYEFPIDYKNPKSFSSFSDEEVSIESVIDIMNTEVIDILNMYGFEDVIKYGENILISRSN
jgi:hypothetical protein